MSDIDDAARAAAARTYPDSWETGRSEALAFIKGAAWQRAQIAARRDEAIRALDGLTYVAAEHEFGPERVVHAYPTAVVNAVLAALGVSDQ